IQRALRHAALEHEEWFGCRHQTPPCAIADLHGNHAGPGAASASTNLGPGAGANRAGQSIACWRAEARTPGKKTQAPSPEGGRWTKLSNRRARRPERRANSLASQAKRADGRANNAERGAERPDGRADQPVDRANRGAGGAR